MVPTESRHEYDISILKELASTGQIDQWQKVFL